MDSYTRACPNDTTFYQACGNFDFRTSPDGSVLCGYFICTFSNYGITVSGSTIQKIYSCDGKADCLSGVDERGCKNHTTGDEFICSVHGEVIPIVKVCNRECDCADCSDEFHCHGLEYGYRCAETEKYILPFLLCNGADNCKYGDDEHPDLCFGIIRQEKQRCLSHLGFKYHQSLSLTNYTRCFPGIQCENQLESTNCTDKSIAPLRCNVSGCATTVAKDAICPSKHSPLNLSRPICDDGIDRECLFASPKCYIHKHQLCNTIISCPDGSDQNNVICRELMLEKCERRYSETGIPDPIPLLWIGDGVMDCRNGIDEDVRWWPTCQLPGFNKTVPDSSTCEDVFICPDKGVIEMRFLCDRVNSCGKENDICRVSHGDATVHVDPIAYKNKIHLGPCLPGIKDHSCASRPYPSDAILGVKPNQLIVPEAQIDCRHTYGAVYLFLSCSGCCRNSICPMRSYLKYNSCPQQLKDRVYALVKGIDLTLAYQHNSNFKVYNMFECDNGLCIEYREVCNLVDNCGDGSDEKTCSNNFKCDISRFVSIAAVCDGRNDCDDLTDECNGGCGRMLIPNTFLKIAAWVVGVVAVVLNSLSVITNSMSVWRNTLNRTIIPRALIVLISSGDFLMGVYLIFLSAADAHYGRNFCLQQRQWLVSPSCTALGLISTLGSQLSLFAMTALSINRMLGVLSRSKCKSKNIRLLLLSMLCILLTISAVITAVSPLLKRFEDYFVNAIYYPDNPLFRGFRSKYVLGEVVVQYHGRVMLPISHISWVTIRKLITAMFTNSYGGTSESILGFYGNDAVCVFKFFVAPSDPQLYFTWSVLSLDLFCFILIAVSYGLVNIKTMQTSRKLNTPSLSGRHKVRQERQRRLHRKIVLIITTDFLCWSIFVMVAALHTMEIIKADKWYSIFSILILPLNSVLNPILYGESINRICGIFTKWVSSTAETPATFKTELSPTEASSPSLLTVTERDIGV